MHDGGGACRPRRLPSSRRRQLPGGGGRFLPAALARARGSRALVALLRLGGLLGLGVLLRLLARRFGAIHELQDHHGGAVAGAGARVDDTGVAAVPVREAGGDGVEELLHHPLVPHHSQDLPLGVEVLALGEGHHLIGEPPHRLGLGLGGHDPLVAEQGHQEIAEHRPAMGGEPSPLVVRPPVSHFTPPRPSAPSTAGSMRIPSESPSPAMASLISSIASQPSFFTFSSSASVFCTRSATVRISALRSALMARAGSGSSSRALDKLSWRNPSPAASNSSSSSGPPGGASSAK